VTDGSVEVISGTTDCTTRDREFDATEGYRFLYRCLGGGIKAFLFGIVPVDANGDPDDTQSLPSDDLQDFIDAYVDLGWSVASGNGIFDPQEFNQSVPLYVFYRDDCQPGNCTVPGDVPGSAFLTLPTMNPVTAKWRILPLGPQHTCYDPLSGLSGPCWSYIDCNDVRHYAACTADGVAPGFTPAYAPCDACPLSVHLEQSSWGRIKALYRGE